MDASLDRHPFAKVLHSGHGLLLPPLHRQFENMKGSPAARFRAKPSEHTSLSKQSLFTLAVERPLTFVLEGNQTLVTLESSSLCVHPKGKSTKNKAASKPRVRIAATNPLSSGDRTLDQNSKRSS